MSTRRFMAGRKTSERLEGQAGRLSNVCGTGGTPILWLAAAAGLLVFGEEVFEGADFVGVFGVEVVALGEVGGEFVEFAGVVVGCVTALVFEPLGLEAAIWWAVVVAGGGVEEDPVALADGE